MSFYDDMSQVATELLTEFGTSIFVTRDNSTADPVTGVKSGGSVSFTLVGLVNPYKDQLIDGSTILASDRLLVSDSKVAPLINDVVRWLGSNYIVVNVTTTAPAGAPVVYFSQLRL